MWIVGGAANQSEPNYPGLQKYSFSTKSWKSIKSITTVTKNRRNHAAVFLNQTAQLLVYAGSQDDPSIPSSETFALDTTEPYNVVSYSSTNTPVLAPELLPWDGNSAITVGGSRDSRDIYHFAVDSVAGKGGWTKYDTELTQPLKSRTQERATLVQGSDGSKVLDLYDFSVSPGQVSSYVLLGSNGKPAKTGQRIGSKSSSRRKRDLSLQNWPSYNDTAAPAFARSGYAIAQSPSGLVAITGGNDEHPMSLFNEQGNEWIDPSKFFGEKDVNTQSFLGPSSSSPPTPSSTSGPLDGPSNLPGSNHHRTSVILGAVLGSILGLIALLIVILLVIRYRRRKRHQGSTAEQLDDEKRRMSFADRGAPYMMDGDGEKQPMSHDSVAILTGKYDTSPHRRLATAGSDSSTTRLVPRKEVPAYGGEAMEMNHLHDKPTATSDGNRTLPLASTSSRDPSSAYTSAPQRTSGWSRYFTTSNAAAGAGVGGVAGARMARKSSGISGKSRKSSDTASNYTTESAHDCSTHGPTEIPPLKLGQEFEGGRVSKIVTGTPPASPPSTAYGDRTTGASLQSLEDRHSRPRTMSSEGSAPSTIDETLFSKPPSHQDSNYWTPVTRSDWTGPKLRDAAPSSIYSHTPRTSEARARSLGPIFEDSSPPAQAGAPYTAQGQPPARASDPDTWPRPPTHGNAAKTVETMPPMPSREAQVGDIYDEAPSTPTATTAIPIPASTAMQYTVKKPPAKPVANSDMSWLNLGPLANK